VGHLVVPHEVGVDDRYAAHDVVPDQEHGGFTEESVGHHPGGQTVQTELQAGPVATVPIHGAPEQGDIEVPEGRDQGACVGERAGPEQVEVVQLILALPAPLGLGADGHQALGGAAGHEADDAGATGEQRLVPLHHGLLLQQAQRLGFAGLPLDLLGPVVPAIAGHLGPRAVKQPRLHCRGIGRQTGVPAVEPMRTPRREVRDHGHLAPLHRA